MSDSAALHAAPGKPSAPKVSKKGIWSWMLFDWAAQPYHTLLVTFIFAGYFAAEVAPDPVTGQTWWSAMLTISGLSLAVAAPILGAVADASGPRKPWIALFSLIAILGACYLWFARPGEVDNALLVLIAFGVMLFGIEFALVFANAVMPDLVPRDELGRLSGTGWALGYVGGVISLIIVLALMVEASPGSGATLVGVPPVAGLDEIPRGGERASGPFTVLWYVVFALPFFLFTPDVARKAKVDGAVVQGLRSLKTTIVKLPETPSLFAFMGSSMFYRDALNGLYTFGGIYARGVLEWSVTQLGVFGILAAITGALGAFFGGRLDDAKGPRFVIKLSIIVLIVVCIGIVTTNRSTLLMIPIEPAPGPFALPDIMFYICGALIGAAGGALQAASRTLMTDQAQDGKMTEAFGLYALSGKATSFLAPAMIGLFTLASGSQQVGLSALIIIFIAGLILLRWVREHGDDVPPPAERPSGHLN
ncbi:MAG: MFS transporter [Ahrensia sp.]|nr:MFS transporter [Ahrensia sp.]